MKTVYKYPVERTDHFTIEMPLGAKVLHFALDPGGRLCLWALVDINNDSFPHCFRLAGTGHPLGSDAAWNYVGSCQDDIFIWHLFQEPL